MFKNWIDQNKDSIIASTQQLLQIPSVGTDPAGPDKPFGVETARALDFMLELGKKNGFTVKNVDGYAGHIEYGNSDEYVAVLAHLDVVPAGSGWTYPPFAAEIHDGILYARGAVDDKGPAMAAFYALLAVKESGVQVNRRIRLILGIDEETDWRCMDHYFKYEPQPWGGFTPDADFPLIYAEKGIVSFALHKPIAVDQAGKIRVLEVTGGERPNMVPDACSAVLFIETDSADSFSKELQSYCEQENVQYQLTALGENKFSLQVTGVSAHGSLPHLGVNAVQKMGQILQKFVTENLDIWEFIASADIEGRFLSIQCADDVTGALSCNLGMFRFNDQSVRIVFDVRYPIDQTLEVLINLLQAAIVDKGYQMDIMHDLKPLYVPKDSAVVTKLSKVYETTTGNPSEPITIGGGTYARTIPNAVAFGPMFPGMEDVVHQKDERISLEHFLQITNIYADAIYELIK